MISTLWSGTSSTTRASSYALKSARRFEAILSLLFALGPFVVDVLSTRGILSLKEPESKSVAFLSALNLDQYSSSYPSYQHCPPFLTADGRK